MQFAKIVALVLLLVSRDVTAEEDGTSTRNNAAADYAYDNSELTTSTTNRQRRRLRRRNKQIHARHHRHAAISTLDVPPHLLSHRIVLVRGQGTSLCWTVDNGRYDTGTLLVLDDCDVSNRRQYFVRENYSYDVESGAYSWRWRPVGWEFEAESGSDGNIRRNGVRGGSNSNSNSFMNTLYVVGHRYSPSVESSEGDGRWRMVLDALPGGVTDPLTQVFWTMNSNSDAEVVDLMGMGQHAWRLFVSSEGDVAERDVPVVLRTETNIREAEERYQTTTGQPIITRRHGLDEFEEEVYQLNGRGRKEEEVVVREAVADADAGGSVAGVIPGKWSYINVG